jgi:hypothetical protein
MFIDLPSGGAIQCTACNNQISRQQIALTATTTMSNVNGVVVATAPLILCRACWSQYRENELLQDTISRRQFGLPESAQFSNRRSYIL